MANKQLAEAALKVIQDKQFNAWLKSIGKEGLKLILKLFVETAKKDLKLAEMAKQDPENTMILFAYQVYLQLSKQREASLSLETLSTEPEEDELEDMNNPPLTSPISAKFGAKLNHIIKLNGHCPEGYEIQYYSMGGHLCGKCRKKKLMLMLNMACGGKKRIKKGSDGMEVPLSRDKSQPIMEQKELPVAPNAATRDSIIKAFSLFKKGGKTLTKAKANSLKYKGGPGDINSTEGMKPNKKQKKMLSRKVGGMVNNAEKITIYQQPDMVDYIKY